MHRDIYRYTVAMHASQTPLLKLARTERNVAIGPGESLLAPP